MVPSPVRLCRSCLWRFGDLSKNTSWKKEMCPMLEMVSQGHFLKE